MKARKEDSITIQTRYLIVIAFIISIAFFAAATTQEVVEASKSHPEDFTFEVASYTEAKNNKNFLRVDLSAKLFFLFKNNFSGYVKKLNVTGEYVDSQLLSTTLTFEPQALDTNIRWRDKKLRNITLDAKRFPLVTVTLRAPLRLNGAQATIPAAIQLRGRDIPIEIQYVTKESADFYIVDGRSVLTFSKLNLPNPSNFFAKLDDNIALEFHFDVKKNK